MVSMGKQDMTNGVAGRDEHLVTLTVLHHPGGFPP